MTIFNFILWDVSPEWFSIGPLTVRWYGLLFALGFLLGQQILIRIYKGEGKSEKHVETLTIYMVIATVIGARLGHCLFYQPDYYLTKEHFIEIFKIWEGGLASHGATIGILIAIYLYSKKETDQSYFYVLDRLVITIALAGCLIRLGNLMNSEIVGKPTNFPTAFLFVHDASEIIESTHRGVVKEVSLKENGEQIEDYQKGVFLSGIDIRIEFEKNIMHPDSIGSYVKKNVRDSLSSYRIRDNIVLPVAWNPEIKRTSQGTYMASVNAFAIPRHPSQLYESISSFLLFLLLLFIYSRKKSKTPEGRIFGLFVVILFTLRFLYEYQKENQVDAESQIIESIGMNIGQILSVPLILAGLFILMRSFRKKNEII